MKIFPFRITFSFLLALFFSQQIQAQSVPSPYTEGYNTLSAYEDAKTYVQDGLDQYRTAYKNAGSEGKKVVLKEVEDFFINQFYAILHFWYATYYDFNGHTELPRNGFIACGYLVSTIYKHMGFKVNRIKMGQQDATTIVHTFCRPNSIKTLRRLDDLLKYIDEEGEGIYLVGLDTHIGFIGNKFGVKHFSHASPLPPQTVVQDDLELSTALAFSTIYVIGKMSDNHALYEKWLQEKNISLYSKN